MPEIRHKRTMFLGRNGYYKSIGVSVRRENTFDLYDKKSQDRICIEPITSRGLIGRCSIEVPPEAIPDLIKLLLKVKKQKIDMKKYWEGKANPIVVPKS